MYVYLDKYAAQTRKISDPKSTSYIGWDDNKTISRYVPLTVE